MINMFVLSLMVLILVLSLMVQFVALSLMVLILVTSSSPMTRRYQQSTVVGNLSANAPNAAQRQAQIMRLGLRSPGAACAAALFLGA